MTLQRGAPCWSTQIIRMVRSPCSWMSSADRSPACCCDAVSRPNSLTKPCLPTPRSTLIRCLLRRDACAPAGLARSSCVAAENDGSADRHQPSVLGLLEDQGEDGVVVRVDRGGGHVRAKGGEAPHRVRDVVAVDRECPAAIQVAQVDL